MSIFINNILKHLWYCLAIISYWYDLVWSNAMYCNFFNFQVFGFPDGPPNPTTVLWSFDFLVAHMAHGTILERCGPKFYTIWCRWCVIWSHLKPNGDNNAARARVMFCWFVVCCVPRLECWPKSFGDFMDIWIIYYTDYIDYMDYMDYIDDMDYMDYKD